MFSVAAIEYSAVALPLLQPALSGRGATVFEFGPKAASTCFLEELEELVVVNHDFGEA